MRYIYHFVTSNPSDGELAFEKLALFCGIEIRRVCISENRIQKNFCIRSLEDVVISISNGTLQLLEESSSLNEFLKEAGTAISGIFCYDLHSRNGESIPFTSDIHIQSFQQRALNSLVECRFESSSNEVWSVLANIDFKAKPDPTNKHFAIRRTDAVTTILTREGKSIFLKYRNKEGPTFYFTCAGPLIDLDLDSFNDSSPSILAPYYIPAMIFLREVFEGSSWTPGSKQACFLVDDPYLHSRYGFFEPEKIVKSTAKGNFCLNVAFIPWNYFRSKKKIVSLFKRNTKSLSISFHGCDHTRGEFSNSSKPFLQYKSRLAKKRMNQHEEKTGIKTNNVMVFPQGLFSSEAMDILRIEGFLGAINSTIFDRKKETKLKFSDSLTPATHKHNGLPLFSRNYPEEYFSGSLNLFLGKPAFFVEHHNYFNDNNRRFDEFINTFNSHHSDLLWQDPESCCNHTYEYKRTGKDQYCIKFYTTCFKFRNQFAQRATFNFVSPLIEFYRNPSISVDNHIYQFGSEDEKMVTLAPGECITIQIVTNENIDFDPEYKSNIIEKLKIAIRRLLCDFRDNYFCKIRKK